MSLHGVSHIGLSTLDFEATRTFYEVCSASAS